MRQRQIRRNACRRRRTRIQDGRKPLICERVEEAISGALEIPWWFKRLEQKTVNRDGTVEAVGHTDRGPVRIMINGANGNDRFVLRRSNGYYLVTVIVAPNATPESIREDIFGRLLAARDQILTDRMERGD